MLERNRNLPVPQVSAWSNYALRNVAPAAPLLTGEYVPIAARGPVVPQLFPGLLGGGANPYGPPPAPMAMPPMASRPSDAFVPLPVFEDYLRRFRGSL